MAADNKQVDTRYTGVQQSVDDVSASNPKLKGEASSPKRQRKTLLLILLMLLIISQLIVLLANNGFYDESAEQVKVSGPQVSLTQIKETEADLRKVVNDLNEINNKPDLNEEVDTKKAFSETIVVPSLPAAFKKEQQATRPNRVDTIKKKTKTAATVPSVTAAVPVVQTSEVEVKTDTVSDEFKQGYIKHDIQGSSLDDNADQWSCVHDTSTGLMWEVKSENDDMRKSSYLYSWYNPVGQNIKGKADGGRCKGGIACDTYSYVQEMNRKNYCGHSDWRLPTREQMQTLVNFENAGNKSKIDNKYFPETIPSWYWTSTENNNRHDYAWYVLFRNGHALSDLKERPKHIRLVRETNTVVSSKE